MDDNRIYTIAVIPGDGIGPEITRETVLTLKRAGEVFGQSFRFEEVTAGTQALSHAAGEPHSLPPGGWDTHGKAGRGKVPGPGL